MASPLARRGEMVERLSDRELKAIRELVHEKSGIALHAGKRALITARLQKRVKQGGFTNFEQYVAHVKADKSGNELTALLDAITTSHTAFFREPKHFEFLRDKVLPELASRSGGGCVNGWSAACATGEEPYTIAITCLDRLGDQIVSRLRLLASDLSTRALAIAKAGVYRSERVESVPYETLRRYFEKGIGAQDGTVRVEAHVRRLVEFRQINLLDAPLLGEPFDFIFCRNVMIYFDAQVQQRVVAMLERRLAPGGYLFISHSESLSACRHDLTWVAPAVYQRRGA